MSLSSNQETDQNRFEAQEVIAVMFTGTIVAIAGAIFLLLCFSGNSSPQNSELVAVFRVSAFGLAVTWLRVLIGQSATRYENLCWVLVIMFLLFLPWIASRTAINGFAGMVCDTIFAGVLVSGMFVTFSKRNFVVVLPFLGFGGLLGIALVSVVAGKGYITPFSYENVLAGLQHRDTMFHAAIAGMAEYHGTVSVGLDGVVPISYHALSHRMIGGIAAWLDIPVLKASYLTVLIVTLPLLFYALCEAAIALKPEGWPPLATFPGLIFLLCWPIGLSLLNTSSYFASESYILSLILLLLIVPIMTEWDAGEKTPLNTIVYGAAFAVLVALAASAKISTGAVLMCGVAMFILLRAGFSPIGVFAVLMFCIAPFAFVFATSLGAEANSQTLLAPFHFFFEWRDEAIFHIALVVLAGLAIYKFADKGRSAGNVRLSLFVIALAALTSSMLLKLEAGAAIYFANPAMWICILLLASLLPIPDESRRRTVRSQITIALLVFVSLAVLEKDRWRGVTILTASAERVVAQSTEVAQLNLDLVAQINRTVASEGRDFAVFIAPGLDKFWGKNEICWAQSFLIPALTSQPLLKGLPPEKKDCEVTKHYGLSAYAKRDSASKKLDEPELCAAALEAGFASVLRFETRKSELVRCGSNSEEN